MATNIPDSQHMHSRLFQFSIPGRTNHPFYTCFFILIFCFLLCAYPVVYPMYHCISIVFMKRTFRSRNSEPRVQALEEYMEDPKGEQGRTLDP